MSRIHAKKGVDLLLRAYARVRGEHNKEIHSHGLTRIDEDKSEQLAADRTMGNASCRVTPAVGSQSRQPGKEHDAFPDLVIAGELPAQMSAFRQQQARWARGSTQCLRRLFFPLWRSRMSLFQRIMGTYHLAQYLIYPLVLLFLLLTPPMLLTGRLATLDLRVLALVGLSSPVLYTVSSIRQYGFFKGLWQLLSFPPLIIYGTGITLSNTIAVLMAFSPQHGTFQRTPKYGQHRAGAYTLPFDGMLLAELVLGLYAALGTWLAVELRSPAAPYLALAALAYLGVAITEFLEPFGNSEGVRRTNAPVIERR
jgi:hypothetical protein